MSLPTFERLSRLATQLNKPVVLFDLEHTGGAKDHRHITEIALLCVKPYKPDIEQFQSLVKPAPGAYFNPFATRLTGITPAVVRNAPSWKQVSTKHLAQYDRAVWIGFGSKSGDLPIVKEESIRHGLPCPIAHHVDLRSVCSIKKGSLSELVSHRLRGVDISGVHRAMKDAWFTALLAEDFMRTGELGAQIVFQALGLRPQHLMQQSQAPCASEETEKASRVTINRAQFSFSRNR